MVRLEGDIKAFWRDGDMKRITAGKPILYGEYPCLASMPRHDLAKSPILCMQVDMGERSP